MNFLGSGTVTEKDTQALAHVPLHWVYICVERITEIRVPVNVPLSSKWPRTSWLRAGCVRIFSWRDPVGAQSVFGKAKTGMSQRQSVPTIRTGNPDSWVDVQQLVPSVSSTQGSLAFMALWLVVP